MQDIHDMPSQSERGEEAKRIQTPHCAVATSTIALAADRGANIAFPAHS